MHNKLKNIFTVFLATMLLATRCFGAPADCQNEFYRKSHPKQCPEIKSDTISGTTIMAILGGATLVGAGIALANKTSDNSGSSSTNQPNDTIRSASITYELTDTIKNKKISASYITSATNGSDISPETIELIKNSDTYTKNSQHFDLIKLPWSYARGFSGKNVKINVLDDFEHYHGDAVHDIINYVAKDATIYDSYLTTAKNKFKSFNDIANIMQNAASADIYNNSWQIDSLAFRNAATVAYEKFDPKTYKNAQSYLYALTSHNFITETVNLAVNNDSILVWAAGNDSQSESGILSALPLAFPELNGHFVNVVSIDPQTQTLAWYSNQCGVTQNYCIAAPGSDIQTDARESKVLGTSFAAPIVTGAIAIIKEAFPHMTATQITTLLFTTAKDLGKPGVDEVYGWGLLDLEAATKPVGTPKIILSDNNIIPLTETNVGGIAGAAIKNAGIKLAFVDDFNRAFITNLSDNINIIPYGRAYEKLTEPENNSINLSDNIEVGFTKNNLLEANGVISSQSSNINTFIGYSNIFNIANIELYQNIRLGMSAPKFNHDSIISGFSDIYTTSIKTGLKYKDFGFEFSIPETIINGNAYMTLPVAQTITGQMIYNNFAVNLTTRPSFEYSIKYKNMSVGYINNSNYQDEFYIMAKTKLEF